MMAAAIVAAEVVEDSSVIFEWLPKTFPEEAKRVFVPEVGLDKPVAAMVMGALMGVMGDTTNDGGKQKEALDAWPTALAPLEGALEKHGMLGVGGKVSAADFRAAAFIYLAELIAPLLPGVLRNLDVLGKYPNISRWMGEGGVRTLQSDAKVFNKKSTTIYIYMYLYIYICVFVLLSDYLYYVYIIAL